MFTVALQRPDKAHFTRKNWIIHRFIPLLLVRLSTPPPPPNPNDRSLFLL
jgi:hypothetical protein